MDFRRSILYHQQFYRLHVCICICLQSRGNCYGQVCTLLYNSLHNSFLNDPRERLNVFAVHKKNKLRNYLSVVVTIGNCASRYKNIFCNISQALGKIQYKQNIFATFHKLYDFRYIAIVRPLKPRISKVCAFVLIIVIWVGSGLLAIPAVLYSKTWTFE